MPKKSFKDNPAMQYINAPNTHSVQDTQNTQDTQKAQTKQRINMAFTADNLEYLQIISRIEGKSITEYVNRLIKTDREARDKEIKQAKQILKGAK